MCSSVTDAAEKNATSLLPQAKAVADMFYLAFQLFAKCDNVYNSACFLQDQEIEDLSKSIHSIYMILESKMYLVSILNSGKSIDDFLAYYRANFPQASVTPKMHMLEDHVVPFLREWHVGFGFHGEQGAESLHAIIRRISRSYASMPNRVEMLKSIIKAHHLQVSPLLQAQEPESLFGRATGAILLESKPGYKRLGDR